MAKNDTKGASDANDRPAGAKPTEATDTNAALTAAGRTDPPVAGDRQTLDPESDLGKAAARDKEAAGGAIRAEDNTDAGRRPDGEAEASGAGTDPSVGEKIEVETTGDFMLQDPYSLDTIEATGTSKVTKTAFTDAKLASGQLKLA
jgi:hypothetical protein